MQEAYAAIVIGVVCGAAAVVALHMSKSLPPMPYTAVHIATVLIMVALVTLGYEHIPLDARYPQLGLSRLLYVTVSWVAFIGTMLVHRRLQPAAPAAS